jgi:hypothetical protein
MKINSLVLPAALFGLSFMSSGAAAQSSNVADAIYVGGDIVTIDEARPTAEALAIKNGKILFVDDVH